MSDPVITVDGLHKKFCRSLRRSMAYGTIDISRAFLGLSSESGKLRKGEFWALEDINFEVGKGETFGLVGANGSGKSTLLRMLNGIFPPDKGKVAVRGRMGALIAVGAGFHPHMTGRENIFLNGTILGMTKEEIRESMDSIIEFAGIGEFLDAPVSTYSSGMYVRLGFAIAIHSRPDIMLVDEILAVGDAMFQRRCLDKIREMRAQGTTFLLVSHNMQNIEAMCSRAVLLSKGKQIMLGTPQEVIPVYELLLQTGEVTLADVPAPVASKDQSDGTLPLIFRYPDFGTDEIKIEQMYFAATDKPEKRVTSFEAHSPIQLHVDLKSSQSQEDAILYLTLSYVGDRKDIEKDYVVLGVQERVNLHPGKQHLTIDLGETGITTGEYKVGLNIFDDTYTNPFTQGYYGYFTVKQSNPTMMRVGRGTPFVWSQPEIKVNKA